MAASTLYWTGGAGDNAFMTAGNWNTQRDGAGSALAPGAGGAGDTLFIEDETATITGGVTGISVLNLTVSHLGGLGVAGTPLNIAVTGTLTIRTQAGSHYIAAVSAGTIATTSIQQTGPGKVWLSGPGAYTTVRVGSNCQVDISTNAAVTTLEQSGGVVEAAYNATVFTTATAAGGTLKTARGATTAYIIGTMKTLGAACVVTTAHVHGKLIVHSTAISGATTVATIGTSICYPQGLATAEGSPYAAIVTDRKNYEGSKNFLNSPNITFTNSAVPIGQA